MNSRPLVAVLYSDISLDVNVALDLEKHLIGEAAEVRSFCVPETMPLDSVPAEVFEACALIVWHSVTLHAGVIERLTRCRAIIRNGAGVDNVDAEAAKRRNIHVCNVPDYGVEEVADHAIALVLALCRQLFPLHQEGKQLGWSIPESSRIRRLSTLTFGLVGMGRIGTAAALRAKALGFRVVFHDPYLPSGIQKSIGVTRIETLDELLKSADVVSIHCPLTKETHGMIDARELGLMKPTAYLVNTARGGIVRKHPLFEALNAGRLAGAGLDVIEDEPLRSAEEAATRNLIVTCHAAFYSAESLEEMRSSAAKLARAAALGLPLWNRVA